MKFKLLILVGLLLFAFGSSQAADSVSMAIYGVTEARLLDPATDTLMVDEGNPYVYELRLSCANDTALSGIGQGFVWMDYSGIISWEAQVDGWGSSGQNTGISATTVETGCRIDPPLSIFTLTGGLLVKERGVDGIVPDSLYIGGQALMGQVPVGPDELWIKIHFSLTELAQGAHSTLSIDSATMPAGGDFIWVKKADGLNYVPNVSPKLTFNVYGLGLAAKDEPGMDHFVYGLNQNFPNPFNPTTVINFTMERKEHVNLSVYNILGQKVVTLVDGELEAGPGSVEWNAVDENGSGVASGIYFYKISTSNFVETRKMILMR